MKTKNGLVTLQVPEGDLKSVFAALDARSQLFENGTSDLNRKTGVEIAHLRKQLTDQAMAQGWKSM